MNFSGRRSALNKKINRETPEDAMNKAKCECKSEADANQWTEKRCLMCHRTSQVLPVRSLMANGAITRLEAQIDYAHAFLASTLSLHFMTQRLSAAPSRFFHSQPSTLSNVFFFCLLVKFLRCSDFSVCWSSFSLLSARWCCFGWFSLDSTVIQLVEWLIPLNGRRGGRIRRANNQTRFIYVIVSALDWRGEANELRVKFIGKFEFQMRASFVPRQKLRKYLSCWRIRIRPSSL